MPILDSRNLLSSSSSDHPHKKAAQPKSVQGGLYSQPFHYRIKCTHEIKAHAKTINSLSWTNTDDRWFVTASND